MPRRRLLYQGTYDDDGKQKTETRAGLGQVTWTYDAFGRLVHGGQGHRPERSRRRARYQYDGDNRMTAYYDAENSNRRQAVGDDLYWRRRAADHHRSARAAWERIYGYPSDARLAAGRSPARVREPNGRVPLVCLRLAGAAHRRLQRRLRARARSPWECEGARRCSRSVT